MWFVNGDCYTQIEKSVFAGGVREYVHSDIEAGTSSRQI